MRAPVWILLAAVSVSVTAPAPASVGVVETAVTFHVGLPCGFLCSPCVAPGVCDDPNDWVCDDGWLVAADSWDEISFTVPEPEELGFTPRYVRFGDTDRVLSGAEGFLCKLTIDNGVERARWVATAYRGSDCDTAGAFACYREDVVPASAGDRLVFRLMNAMDTPGSVQGSYAVCSFECRTTW